MLQLLNELTGAMNPWREFDRFEANFNRLLPDSFAWLSANNKAPVNIYANDEGVRVMVRLPGWKPEWFDLSLEGSQLHLHGETKFQEKDGQGRSQFKLSRIINLPYRVEPDRVKAGYKNGILTVDMVKPEEDRAKKIAIEAA